MNLHTHPARIAAAMIALSAPALAQNDECATAQSVSVGTAAFDTTAATLSPEVWGCALGGGPDLWFTYTAPVTGQSTISTCGTSYDTALEVYEGSCGALVLIECNDDSCAFQSSVQFAATMGTTYTFRIGGYNGAVGTGTLTVDDGRPRLNAMTGNYYAAIALPGMGWDDARAAAQAMTFMGMQGDLATITSQQENDFIFGLGNVNNYWLGGFQNLSSPSYSEPGGGWEWVTGEPFTYTNWLPGEPNNTGAFPSEDYLELLQSGGFGETWNDAHPMEHPAGYIVEFGNGGFGMNYCMAAPNSTGGAGTMSASGSSIASANDLTLMASGLPSNQFGIFLTSRIQAFVPGVGGTSNGNLCLGGSIGRFNLAGQIFSTGSTGSFELVVNTTMVPEGAALRTIMPGDTWNFQGWHRDGVGLGSNFTDGLELMFN